ncbi:lytic polysaccharide monooxygenase [Chitinilyticum aquatile]|uniref:lytic polysaccharide monooxygenase n=1 Tax=Chitinilyticum aquatile TaxID=362520 RepID=UPI0003FE5BC2|nr:lytic polysaccharide monooxygenase [Chitinilyticum aquatile]
MKTYRLGLALLGSATVLLHPATALAHGTMADPISRVLQCFNEGPEAPKSAACQAAVAQSGPQMLYDWSGVNQLPNGNHKAFVPDGQLCGGGKSNYAGLNLARTDWPTTPIAANANGQYDFIFKAPAPHQTSEWALYVTRDSWDPTQPLKWSDLERFCTLGNIPVNADKTYKLTCPLPKKTGKHVIYATWQRSDSAEAFYSCSDVSFSGGVSTFKDLGQVRAYQDLAENSKISFRLFDAQGLDLEKTELIVGIDNQSGQNTGLASNWPYFLAQKVNASSRHVSIGVLQGNGSVTAIQNAQDNHVYSRNGASYTFRIDIEGASSPTPTAAPTVTPTGTPSTTPTITPTAAPTTTPTPAGSCAAAWDAGKDYVGGSRVSYNGKQWEASWWVRGEEPGSQQWGAWKEVGKCTSSPTITPVPSAAPTIIPSATPTATPTSKPTATVTPVITPTLTPTSTPGTATCAVAWDAKTAYTNPGTTVSYQGRNYQNKWWIQGDVPAVSGQWGPWKDLGTCK